MSMAHERSALGRSVSLFDHARRLHKLTPDGPLPDGGHPFPDGDADQPYVPHCELKAALAAVLREFLADPTRQAQDLHDRCTHLAITALDVPPVLAKLAIGPSPRLLDTARWLIRNGTDRRAVLVGLGMLHGKAEQQDIPVIKMIGLLCFTERSAVEVLAGIPDAAQDLIWLAERSQPSARIAAIQALTGRPEPLVRDWLLSTPGDLLSSEQARKLAKVYELARMLSEPTAGDSLWDQTGTLLCAMTCTHNYTTEISRYEPAPSVYQRWVALADARPPTVERAAMLATIAEDLATGPAAPVVGEPRGALIGQIRSVLSSQPWTEMLRRRASSDDPVEARCVAWIVDASTRIGIPEGRFAIRVVLPDPNPVGFTQVEARIVIDGMPAVAAAFDKGPAGAPEQLLCTGRLKATAEPKEVRLAEAYCTEGCCGGLYVTIVREGTEVIWKDWRSSTPGGPPSDVRFDATEYDREVARAAQDHGWEWPARTLARLITERLRADPTVRGPVGLCTGLVHGVAEGVRCRAAGVHPSGEYSKVQ